MERNIDRAMANIIASLKNVTLYGLYDELGSMKTVVRYYIKLTVTECAKQQQEYEIQQSVYAPLGGISDEVKEPKKNIDAAMANVIEVLNNPELYGISIHEANNIAPVVKGYIESIVTESSKQQDRNIDIAMANVMAVLNNPKLYSISLNEVNGIASVVKGYMKSTVTECAKQQQSEEITAAVIGRFGGDAAQKTASLF